MSSRASSSPSWRRCPAVRGSFTPSASGRPLRSWRGGGVQHGEQGFGGVRGQLERPAAGAVRALVQREVPDPVAVAGLACRRGPASRSAGGRSRPGWVAGTAAPGRPGTPPGRRTARRGCRPAAGRSCVVTIRACAGEIAPSRLRRRGLRVLGRHRLAGQRHPRRQPGRCATPAPPPRADRRAATRPACAAVDRQPRSPAKPAPLRLSHQRLIDHRQPSDPSLQTRQQRQHVRPGTTGEVERNQIVEDGIEAREDRRLADIAQVLEHVFDYTSSH